MLDYELLEKNRILVVSPQGALDKADFQRLSEVVDPYLQENGSLDGLMVYTQSFPGWHSFAALISHLRFVKEHQKRIKKVAAVTSSSFLTVLPKIATYFIEAEVKTFDYDAKEEALNWLRSG